MARTNKNSRIKGLPGRIQLSEEDSSECSSRGQSYDDTSTIVFAEQVDVSYGAKLAAGSRYLSSELSSSLNGPANIISGISDTWLVLSGASTRNTGTITPFRDSGNPAVEGLSSGNTFFSTGSAVSDIGEGFSQPLWSKTKIEISIPSNPCSFKMVISQSAATDTVSGGEPGYISGSSYPMAYYNFDTHMWEGIGTGWALQANKIEIERLVADVADAKQVLTWTDSIEYATIGFNPGILNLRTRLPNQLTSSAVIPVIAAAAQQEEYANHFLSLEPPKQDIVGQYSAGMPTDSYGFPYAAKFHATSSQLCHMSNYIDRPFLLEKVVLEISGAQFTMFDSIDPGGYYSLTSSVFPATVNNFFILNQRKNSKYEIRSAIWQGDIDNELNFSVPRNQELTPGSYNSQTYVTTTRDLVTFGGITGYTNDLTDFPTKEIILRPFDLFAGDAAYTDLVGQVSGAEVGFPIFAYNNTTSLPITQSYNVLNNVSREYNIHISASMSSSVANLSWTNNLSANFQVVSPNLAYSIDSTRGPTYTASSAGDNLPYSYGSFEYGGSNGLGFNLLSGRRLRADFINGYKFIPGDDLNYAIFTGGVIYTVDYLQNKGFDRNTMANPISRYDVNPYILLPSDELVFGWQLPTPQFISNQMATSVESVENRNHFNSWLNLSVPASGSNRLVDICQMSFDGPGKVVFYGSYVSEDKEDHAVQVNVNTNAIHGVIGN